MDADAARALAIEAGRLDDDELGPASAEFAAAYSRQYAAPGLPADRADEIRAAFAAGQLYEGRRA